VVGAPVFRTAVGLADDDGLLALPPPATSDAIRNALDGPPKAPWRTVPPESDLPWEGSARWMNNRERLGDEVGPRVARAVLFTA
jgi:hypothetical protein